ncbi:MAG: MATE family efflux transporter [Methanolinea sp.]|jgi:putative MATE family efflux protein|nr:MATE family efflux transporter [Methanolinea sp.]
MTDTSDKSGVTPDRAFDEQLTKGVSILRGDPEVAVRKLAGPMIVAMLLIAIYNLADAIWVSGISSDALAGVGFVTPLFMILMALSNGLGAGATSVVARCIGARDKEGADTAASHAILTAFIVSAFLMIVFVLFLRPIVVLLGAGPVTDIAVEYGQIVFLGTVFFLVVQMAYAVLRAEGDTKRTMYAMAVSSVLNIILDPILIYGAGLGVAGAAIATVISIASVLVVLAYWFLVKKDTFVSLKIRGFPPDMRIVRSILGVGIPASLEYLLLSVMSLSINLILVTIAGTDAVAVYTSGWRIVMFAIVPLVGIATSVIAVSGAAYGAREYEKIRIVHRYSIRIGVVIGLVTGILTYLLSPQITALFTYSPGSAHLSPAFILFFQTMCFFYPFIPLGMFSSSVFQGTGHGFTSLVISLLRALAFDIVFAFILGMVLGLGEFGVYSGIVVGNIIGGFIGYLWAGVFLDRLVRIG